MKIRQALSIIFLLMALSYLEAQSNFSADLGTDLVNRYVWRGQSLSNTPSIQPYTEISFNNLTLGSWGSYSFGQQEMQEVDLYLSYGTNFLTFTLNDYFNPTDTYDVHHYFDLDKNTTLHVLEAIVEVADIPNVPVTLSAGVMFYGCDLDENGKSLYSTYVEVAYPFSINETELNLFVGATPAAGFYNDKAGIVNAGLGMSKEISITESYSLPLSGSFIVDPSKGNVFLVVGVSF